MGQKITKGDTSKYILKVAVCGDPNVIKIYMDKRTDLSANQDGYKLLIDPVRGNGSNGIIKDMDVDLYLCVYNVRDLNTLKLLRQNILPDVQSMGKKMAIAGLGVEYRVESDPMHSSVHLIQNLGEQYNCPVSEIITSDPTQMAVGTYALYSATLPEQSGVDAVTASFTSIQGTYLSDSDKWKTVSNYKPEKLERQLVILLWHVVIRRYYDFQCSSTLIHFLRTNEYDVHCSVMTGNGLSSGPNFEKTDIVLGVCDIFDYNTVEYLRNEILSLIKGPREFTAIAGMNAECRTYLRRAKASMGTCGQIVRMSTMVLSLSVFKR
ncbi:unnamed protein product [Hymenolepis diminuta]|uniref:Uncharacterized protein n=1 Tax=Hymenolepis diminuta TaxID=6216 RepID=A0A564YUA6_HYMDI|nr:unnamed protein product [Hymenolepis diminuta]